MKYYSAIKKNEIISFARKWIELEIIMLSGKKNRIRMTITAYFLHM
jgi:hypothetical protein